MIASCLLAIASPAGAAELLRDTNNPVCWTFQKSPPGEGAIRQAEGAIRIDVTHAGTDNWHVQIFQDKLTVRDGADYLLTFRAKASAPRKMKITSQASDSPWRYVLAPTFQDVELTTQWKDYSVPLHFQDARNDAIRVPMFLVGDIAGTVWIKNASVTFGPAGPSSYAGESVPLAPAASGDLLHDPMNPASWKFDNRGNTGNSFRSDGGTLRLDITNANTDRHSVTIYQLPQGLSEGRMYTLAITARASSARAITFGAQRDVAPLERDVAPLETVVPDTSFNISTDWKQYLIRFRLRKVYPGQTRLPCLSAGDTAGTVFIKAISLTPYEEVVK